MFGTTVILLMVFWVFLSSGCAGQAEVPAAPSAGDVQALSANSIRLQWTNISNNLEGFRVERSLSASGGFIEIGTVDADITAYEDTGLAPNTKYYYRVRAFNGAGKSDYSNVASATTQARPIGAPAPPSTANATALSSSSVRVTWSDGSNNETGFKIERSLSNSSGFVEIGTVAAGVITYEDAGLTAGTTYYYRVRAHNSAGDSPYSNVASTATQTPAVALPSAPASLSAQALSSSSVRVTWTDNSNDETGFKIERGAASSGSFSQIGTVDANVTTYDDTGLSASTTYFYRVRAYNAAGDSGYSETASATTQAPSPAEAILRVVNNSSHPIISLALDDNEYFYYPNGILPGKYYEMSVSLGRHTLRIANGFYNGTSKFEMYEFTWAYTQTSGTYIHTFSDPTINQLLTQFKGSGTWEGMYWDSNTMPHAAKFVFSSSGTWTFFDDNVQKGSGSYSLVSRGELSIVFTIGSHQGTLPPDTQNRPARDGLKPAS